MLLCADKGCVVFGLLPVCVAVAAAGDRSGAQIVDDTLRAAASRGINTVRMWAHTTNSIYPFQVGGLCTGLSAGGKQLAVWVDSCPVF